MHAVRACSPAVCLGAVQCVLSNLESVYELTNSSFRDHLHRRVLPTSRLPSSGTTQTDYSIPIVPCPPHTCQRLTTNRPIENAPDKPLWLLSPPEHFRSDWDLAYYGQVTPFQVSQIRTSGAF